jgi:hypothetical protein
MPRLAWTSVLLFAFSCIAGMKALEIRPPELFAQAESS